MSELKFAVTFHSYKREQQYLNKRFKPLNSNHHEAVSETSNILYSSGGTVLIHRECMKTAFIIKTLLPKRGEASLLFAIKSNLRYVCMIPFKLIEVLHMLVTAKLVPDLRLWIWLCIY